MKAEKGCRWLSHSEIVGAGGGAGCGRGDGTLVEWK